MNHLADIARRASAQNPAAKPAYDAELYQALMGAAQRFGARIDAFALGKGAICRDLANKLVRYGSFASDKQEAFARKLVEWSQPRDKTEQAISPTPRPNTWVMIQHFAHVTIGAVKFSKKNAEQLWWITYNEALVGMITAEGAKGFATKIRTAGLDAAEIKAALDAIEADPKAALQAHGLATGSCGCCSRELTDPESISRGIGPICWAKGGF
jgi:hypothetical protein